jgi:hypothetical protein
MAVVGLSVISSATTTLVVLGPASFEVVGAVARIAFDKPERPSTHSSLAAVPPVSASALRETPLVEPVISPAGSSDGDTVEIQANRPESTTRKFVGGASPGAPGFRADGVASKNTPAQPVLPVPNAATPSDEASSAEASNPGGSPDHQNDDGTSAGDDGPDYGF